MAVLQVDTGTLWNFFVKGAVFELERSSEGVLRFRFDRPNRCSVMLLLIVIFSGSSLSLQAQKSVGSSKEFALVGARIYPAPDAKPIVNGIVVVANGKIVSVGEAATLRVPKGMRTIDCAGKTLVAGLWNTHVHFMEPKWDHAADLPAHQLTEQLQDMLTKKE